MGLNKTMPLLVLLILLVGSVSALDFSPNAPINQRGLFSVYNIFNLQGKGNLTWNGSIQVNGSEVCTADNGLCGPGDNTSWNQSYANTLYEPLGIVASIGNWTADKTSYYTKLYVDSLGNASAVNTRVTDLNTTLSNQLASLPNLSIAQITTANGNWSADKPSYATEQRVTDLNATTTSMFGSLPNLSIAQITTANGNWSLDKSSYATAQRVTDLNTSVTSNLTTLANRITSMPNLSMTNITTANGNWSADKSSYYTKIETNNTIDAKIAAQTSTFYATSWFNATGTNSSGNFSNTRAADGTIINLTETVTGGFDYFFNYTGVTRMNSIASYTWYSGSMTHDVTLSIWNYGTSSWEAVDTFSTQSNYVYNKHLLVNTNNKYNGTNGVVQLRYNHPSPGTAAHWFAIDQLTIQYSTDSVGNGISGGGSAGYLVKFNDASSIGNSRLFEDSAGNMSLDKNLTLGDSLITPKICLGGSCNTAWPAGGSSVINASNVTNWPAPCPTNTWRVYENGSSAGCRGLNQTDPILQAFNDSGLIPPSDGTGGWTNTSTATNTSLLVNMLGSATIAGSLTMNTTSQGLVFPLGTQFDQIRWAPDTRIGTVQSSGAIRIEANKTSFVKSGTEYVTFVNSTSLRVGIGDTTPEAVLDVQAVEQGNTPVLELRTFGGALIGGYDSGNNASFIVNSGGGMESRNSQATNSANALLFYKRGNTSTSQGRLSSGAEIGWLGGYAWNDSQYNRVGYMMFSSVGDQNETNHGGQLSVYLRPPNSGAMAEQEVMRLNRGTIINPSGSSINSARPKFAGADGHAGLTFIAGSNMAAPVLYGYNSAGASILRVTARPFSSDPYNTTFDTNDTNYLAMVVTADRKISMGAGIDDSPDANLHVVGTSLFTSTMNITGKVNLIFGNQSAVDAADSTSFAINPASGPNGNASIELAGGRAELRFVGSENVAELTDNGFNKQVQLDTTAGGSGLAGLAAGGVIYSYINGSGNFFVTRAANFTGNVNVPTITMNGNLSFSSNTTGIQAATGAYIQHNGTAWIIQS